MTGNVREWCLDTYRPYSLFVRADNIQNRPLKDRPWEAFAAAVESGKAFVVRGGSYMTELEEAQVFLREKVGESEQIDDLGLRIVIDCPPSPPPAGDGG